MIDNPRQISPGDRINSEAFGKNNPDRIRLIIDTDQADVPFEVWRGVRFKKYFSEFAEAIAYADKHARMARTNQGENND